MLSHVAQLLCCPLDTLCEVETGDHQRTTGPGHLDASQKGLGRRRLGWRLGLGRPQGGSAPRCGGESAAVVTRPSGEGRTGDRGRWLG